MAGNMVMTQSSGGTGLVARGGPESPIGTIVVLSAMISVRIGSDAVQLDEEGHITRSI